MADAKKTGHALVGAEMTPDGLSYKGVILSPVVEKCTGCERIAKFGDQSFCPVYAKPAQKWLHGMCNFATHVKATVDKHGKDKINPLKASKRAARGR